MIDNGDFNPVSNKVNRTIEYWESPMNGNNTLIGLYFEKQNILSQRATSELGIAVKTITNARATYWYLHPWFYQGYKDLVPDVQIESWLQYRNSSLNADNTYYERDYFENQKLQNDSLNGKVFFLTGYERLQTGTPRSKMFFLSAFYLINNPNLYFLYTDYSLEWFGPDGTILPAVNNYTSCFWIPAVETDIGQPMPNHFGLPDYKGDLNTAYEFEFANGTDPAPPAMKYHIIAREYDNALVLLKWRPSASNLDDTTRTTHALDGTYYPLNTDGTVSAGVTSITLRNNEGAILLKEGIWQCTDWSACISGVESRTCTCSAGYCPDPKPEEQQFCQICTLPNDYPPCDCISNAELSSASSSWFSGIMNILDFARILRARLTCSS
jgi:hypothetical protein